MNRSELRSQSSKFYFVKPNLGVIALALTACLSTSFVAMAVPQTGTAKFVKVEGTVTVDGTPVVKGYIANPSSVVVTAQKSLAQIFIGKNGPDLLIDENSKISIDELTYDNSGPEPSITTRLGVKQGAVSGRVNRMSGLSQYVVSTPNTTAAIRGTVYTVTSSGVVYVFDGSVDVTWTDPSTGRPANFNVSTGQMFDPSIPGVVEIPPGTKKPFEAGEGDTVYNSDLPVPVGPLTFVSPISGSGKK